MNGQYDVFKRVIFVGVTALMVFSTSAFAAAGTAKPSTYTSDQPSYSAPANKSYPRNVYFGDTHLHTSFSPDAGLAGNVSLDPNEAFAFAKGNAVKAHNGMMVKLLRPLDFLVVSDHAEYFGLIPLLLEGDPRVLDTEIGKRWYDMFEAGGEQQHAAAMELIQSLGIGKPLIVNKEINTTMWHKAVDIADAANEPGKFTAFIGYEWTSSPDGGNNLHRVVVFKGDGTEAKQIIPFSAFDSENPEDLWQFLQGYEQKTGGKVLAIPHNSNVSNGLMFRPTFFDGKVMTAEYAKTRMRWEPIVEVTQIKGDSETHPYLSPDDEFADYEKWDKSNLLGNDPKTNEMFQYEYIRSALGIGLQQEIKLGVNPFKFGLIGSTDAHTSLATADNNNFWGKVSIMEPSAERYAQALIVPKDGAEQRTTYGRDMAASGYAAVWATENTRKALFEAMQRKETYATTGPRMGLRFFGGFDYKDSDATSPDFVSIGYEKGVPMGGDLLEAPAGKSPTFLIKALKDPDGANLDRVQVIKGWVDKDGKRQTKIFNVALSDGRTVAEDGSVKPVGNTVDVKNATYENSIGAAQLITMWTDPAFDANVPAFYYVRVLEIPTPRWTAYDAKYFKVDMPNDVEMITIDRAYTSPIWYTPPK